MGVKHGAYASRRCGAHRLSRLQLRCVHVFFPLAWQVPLSLVLLHRSFYMHARVPASFIAHTTLSGAHFSCHLYAAWQHRA